MNTMHTKIRLGDCFLAKFTHKELVVRIEDVLDISANAPSGGWVARSLSHGRKVIIKDVSQIVHRCDENGIKIVADETVPNRRSQKTASPVQVTVPVEPDMVVPLVLPTSPIRKPLPLTLLEAAIVVLRANRRQPMTAREITDTVIRRKLWTPIGETPWQTLHAALSREIAKGPASRFRKAKQRGKFQLK